MIDALNPVSGYGMLYYLGCEYPNYEFAIREPTGDEVYVPPLTIWERVKQVFTGPQKVKRLGVVQVLAIWQDGHLESAPEGDEGEILEYVNTLRAAGMLVEVLIGEK